MVGFDSLYYFLLVTVILMSGWLFVLACASWFHRSRVNRAAPLLRLCVVIPAHNEESGIAGTLSAVAASDYPSHLVRVTVIADNCSDQTAALAEKANVIAVVREDSGRRGKGAALDWFFRQHRSLYEDCDGVVIIDADSRPDVNMLRELSASLNAPGVDVVQGFNGVGNPDENGRTALMAAAFNVFNHLRMAASCRIFGTASLKGLGMAFRSGLLKTYGWPTSTLVEDQEFSLFLARKGIPVHYNQMAIIRSDMDVSGNSAASQRIRWEGGRFSLMRKYIPSLLREILTGKLHGLAMFMDLIIPPLSLLFAIITGLGVVACFFYPDTLVLILTAYIALACYVAFAQVQQGLGYKGWTFLLTAPLFVLWKVCLYMKMLFRGNSVTWGRPRR